jgi:hypothetical protein
MRTNAFRLKPELQAAIRVHCVGWIAFPKLTSRHPSFHSVGRRLDFQVHESSIMNATPNAPANKRPPASLRQRRYRDKVPVAVKAHREEKAAVGRSATNTHVT